MASKLRDEDRVTDSTGRRHGRIVRVLGGGQVSVSWDDGAKTIQDEGSLLRRFTSQSHGYAPTPAFREQPTVVEAAPWPSAEEQAIIARFGLDKPEASDAS